ncbi:MAG TPA: hypothetical protein VF691_08300 [Cytophagaceae bacterium]|jgi:hypothetical protein
MYQNQLFFEDFQKVFKVRIAEQKEKENTVLQMQDQKINSRATAHGDTWLKRIIVRLRLQSMLH